MTTSERDSIVKAAVELITIHPLGLAASLPEQNQSSVMKKGQGLAGWLFGGSEGLSRTAGGRWQAV